MIAGKPNSTEYKFANVGSLYPLPVISLKTVNEFGTYGPSIYKKHNLADVAKTFVEIAEAAQKHVVDETKDWFDGVTVKRNMNELKKQATQFNKIASEAQALQDRMAALYEDMGGILNRYFDIKELNEEE